MVVGVGVAPDSNVDVANHLGRAIADAQLAASLVSDPHRKPLMEATAELQKRLPTKSNERSDDERTQLETALDGFIRVLSPTVLGTSTPQAEAYAAARVAKEHASIAKDELASSQHADVSMAMAWIGETARLFMPWPLIAIILLIGTAAATRPGTLTRLLDRLASINVGGVALTLSEETEAVENSKRIANLLVKARADLSAEYHLRSSTAQVRATLETIVRDFVAHELKWPNNQPPEGFRCTIHVPDALTPDGLCQLIDYWPTGGGAGRAWSCRYGIIGLAWRKLESQHNTLHERSDLIERAGMTYEEASARAQLPKRGFSCTLLRVGSGPPVATLYMDARHESAFQTVDNDFHRKLAERALTSKLTEQVDEISRAVRARSPQLRLFIVTS
jgi:hypothetical protein